MPNNIESRIVTMTFDNAQFEKGVATTQKSLKDLDESLKFKDADKSFDGITKAAGKVSFSQLESNIGTVGTVIEKSMSLGVKAMDRLKDKILDVGESVLKGITQPVSDAFNQIVTGGMNRATKVDKAKFKMAGLGVEWEDIYEDINYGVADTAFGLDQAASAAANLVSAGIDFGETYGATGSSPMAKALRGISGLSAMFDRSYDDIAGLYQVIGAAGRVTNDALSRFQERGIPVTAKLAEAFGTSEEAIKEMAKEGSISVQQFIDVMDNSFGAHAKDSNKTFEGAFDNMNAALSRSGEKFAESYRANMTDVYNSLRTTINALNGSGASNLLPLVTAFDAILRDVADRVAAITDAVKTIFIDSGAWTKTLEAAADIIEGVWSVIVAIIDSFGELSGGTENLVKMADKFSDFASRFRELAQSESFINKVQESVWALKEVFSDVGSVLKPILNMVALIGKEMAFWASPMANINEGQSGLVHFISLLHNVVGVFTSFLKSDLFRDIFNVALAALGTIMHLFTSIGRIVSRLAEAIRTAIASVFGQNSEVTDFGETLARVFDIFHNWIDRLTPSAKFFEGLGKIFQGVLSVVKLLGKAFSTLVNPILNLFDSFSGKADNAFGGFWDILGAGLGFIGNIIVKITEWIDKTNILVAVQDILTAAVSKVVSVVKSVIGWFKSIASVAGEWGKSILEWAKPIGKDIIAWVVTAFQKAVEWIKIAIDWVKKVADAFNEWLKNKTGYSFSEVIQKIGEAIKGVWEKVKGFFVNFPTWVKTAKDAFSGWVESVKGSSFGNFFDKVKESVKGVWESIKGLFDKTADDTSVSRAINNMSPFAKVWESIKNVFSGVFKFFKAVWPVFEAIFVGIANVVSGVFNTLTNLLNNIDWSQFNLAEVLTGGGLAAGGAGIFILFKKIKEFLDGLMNPAEGFKNTFFGQITGTLGAVKGVLTEYQKQIKADVIMTIAKAIAILAASIFVLALVDPDRITLAGTAVAGLLKILGDIITEIYSLSDKGSRETDTGFAKMSLGFTLLAAGVMLLTFAIAKIAKIKIEDLVVGLLALHVLLFEVTNVLTKLANTDNANIDGLGVTLLLLAFTIGKLVKPVKVLGSMNIMQLLQGIIALQMVMKILSDTFELLDKTSKAWSSAKAMTQAVKMIKALAVSMALMVIPVKLLGGMDTGNLGRGLLAVVALIGVMTIAMKFLMKETETLKGDKLKTTKNGSLEGIAVALLALAATMILLIIPLKALANIRWGEIAKMGVIIAGLLLMLGMFNAWGGESKKALLAGVALAELVIVIKMLIKPLQELTDIKWGSIAKAGALIAGMLLFLGMFNEWGGESKGAIAAGAALIIIAVAIRLLIKPLKDLESIDWMSVLKFLAIFAGSLALLALFGDEASKALLLISVAFLIMGAATILVGAGLLLIVAALSALAVVAGPAGVAIKILLTAIATSIPLIAAQLSTALEIALKGLLKAVELLLAGIIMLISNIIDPILGLVSNLLTGIIALAVKFVKDLLTGLKDMIYDIRAFIYEIKDVVADTAKTFLDSLYDLLVEIAAFLEKAEDVISNHIIPSVARIVIGAIDTVLAVLAEHWPSIMESLRILLDGLIQLLIDLTPRIGQFLDGIMQLLIDLLPRVKEFLIQLCMVIVEVAPYLSYAVLTLLETLLGMLPTIADTVINSLVDTFILICKGIGERAQEIVDAALDMLYKIIVAVFVGVWNFLVRIGDDIVGIITDIWPAVRDWFVGKWNEIKETASNILGWFKEGFESAVDAVVAVFTGIWDKITGWFTNIKDTIVGWGKKIIGWFKGGVDDSADELYEAGQNVGNRMVEGTEQSLDEHSPSKKAWEAGKNYVIGMANGVNDNTDTLEETGANAGTILNNAAAEGVSLVPTGAFENAGSSAGTKYGDGMLSSMSGYSDILRDTGVDLGNSANGGLMSTLGNVDLSNLTGLFGGGQGGGGIKIPAEIIPTIGGNGSNLLSSLSSGGSFDLTSLWDNGGGLKIQDSISAIQENQNNDTTATEVVSLREELVALKEAIGTLMAENTNALIDDLGPRVSRLEQAMYNMQVVMDTNAVVGQITPKIDESLGRRATYKGRGN